MGCIRLNWEDRLFAEDERSVVRFLIGDVAFEGSNPCARCPVPSRDPRTGEILLDFTRRFSDLRLGDPAVFP
jgi:uncharacterized protein YcbX